MIKQFKTKGLQKKKKKNTENTMDVAFVDQILLILYPVQKCGYYTFWDYIGKNSVFFLQVVVNWTLILGEDGS